MHGAQSVLEAHTPIMFIFIVVMRMFVVKIEDDSIMIDEFNEGSNDEQMTISPIKESWVLIRCNKIRFVFIVT